MCARCLYTMATTKRNLKKATIPAGATIAKLHPSMKRVTLFGHTYRTLAMVNAFTISAAQFAQTRAMERIFHQMFPGVEYTAEAYNAWMDEHPLEFAVCAQAQLYDVVFTPDGDAPPMSEIIAALSPESFDESTLADLAIVEEHVDFFTQSREGSRPRRDESANASTESDTTPEDE